MVGMVTDQLALPVRPLPGVETRRIDDEQGRLALAEARPFGINLESPILVGCAIVI